MVLNKWDQRFIDLAQHISTWSKDPSTKVGAVIVQDKVVVGMGYNGFPAGVEDNPDLYADRAEKLKRVVHAEANAIIEAGQDCGNATLYVYPLFTCNECAKLVIQSGIRRVVYDGSLWRKNCRDEWKESFDVAMEMYEEAGVQVVDLSDENEQPFESVFKDVFSKGGKVGSGDFYEKYVGQPFLEVDPYIFPKISWTKLGDTTYSISDEQFKDDVKRYLDEGFDVEITGNNSFVASKEYKCDNT